MPAAERPLSQQCDSPTTLRRALAKTCTHHPSRTCKRETKQTREPPPAFVPTAALADGRRKGIGSVPVAEVLRPLAPRCRTQPLPRAKPFALTQEARERRRARHSAAAASGRGGRGGDGTGHPRSDGRERQRAAASRGTPRSAAGPRAGLWGERETGGGRGGDGTGDRCSNGRPGPAPPLPSGRAGSGRWRSRVPPSRRVTHSFRLA